MPAQFAKAIWLNFYKSMAIAKFEAETQKI
jgi:hypothetical protein